MVHYSIKNNQLIIDYANKNSLSTDFCTEIDVLINTFSPNQFSNDILNFLNYIACYESKETIVFESIGFELSSVSDIHREYSRITEMLKEEYWPDTLVPIGHRSMGSLFVQTSKKARLSKTPIYAFFYDDCELFKVSSSLMKLIEAECKGEAINYLDDEGIDLYDSNQLKKEFG